MFVYYFVDPDLRVGIFLEKVGAAENGSVNFEIGDICTSGHLHLRLKKISCRACLLFYCFLVFIAFKISFKSSFELYFYLLITGFF